MPESPISKLEPIAAAAKQRGIKVYQLNIGQPDIITPKEGMDAIRNLDHPIIDYTAPEGLRSYREKLVDYYKRYDISLTADEIIVTTGGSEAIFYAFITCLDPGDELIVSEPVYANYVTFAAAAGIKIRPIQTKIENGFALPPIEEFEKIINGRTRGILICNPSNPTGCVFTGKEMMQLRDMVKKHDLYLFSDEVYREFVYGDTPYMSAMLLEGIEDKVVMLDSMSKRYSECGARIGALITRNKDVRLAVLKLCQARISPPLMGQIMCEASLSAPKGYFGEVYEEYLERRNCLVEGLNKIPGVFCPMPMGAFYAMVSLPVDDSEEFCRWCLADFNYEGETVMASPANGFYITPGAGKNQVRMAYVLKKEDLERAVVVLGKALEAYNKR